MFRIDSEYSSFFICNSNFYYTFLFHLLYPLSNLSRSKNVCFRFGMKVFWINVRSVHGETKGEHLCHRSVAMYQLSPASFETFPSQTIWCYRITHTRHIQNMCSVVGFYLLSLRWWVQQSASIYIRYKGPVDVWWLNGCGNCSLEHFHHTTGSPEPASSHAPVYFTISKVLSEKQKTDDHIRKCWQNANGRFVLYVHTSFEADKLSTLRRGRI